MKLKHFLTLASLVIGGGSLWAQSVGDVITYNDTEYKVTGENLITNGSFDDGVNNWNAGDGSNNTSQVAANASNFTVNTSGGFDDGAYLQYSAGGAKAVTTIKNRIQVESGKTYLFRCYTSGKTPDSNNLQYSKIWASDDGYAETTVLYQLQWGANAGQTSSTWKQNDYVFTATKSWVVFRSSWTSGAKLDGFFLGEVKLNNIADETDYANLNSAISAVEGKAWGFDTDEYAPYNYVEVLQALASAKALDQDAENPKTTVQALTSTINTTMTANTAEVNAIWDPSFEHDYSGQSGNVQPIGWYREKDNYSVDGYNVRYMNLPDGTNTSGHGVFGKFTLMYGDEPGYSLPLKEAYYTLSFIYGGWNEVGTREIKLYNDDNNAEVYTNTVTAKNNQGHITSDAYSNYKGFIKVPAAGNYVLSFYRQNTSAQNQIVLSDFVLKTTTVAEATAYYNTVKDEVDDSYVADANGGSEKTNFKNALDASAPSTVVEIMEAAANLYTLRDAFVAATPKYDAYVAEKANAERIDASITSSVSAPTTAAEAEAALQTILVNEYNYVADNFNADAAATYGITIDQWTGTATSGGNADTPQTNSNEKWGSAATTYYEQGKNGWGSNAWTLNYTKTVTLPANTYVLKVAARASEGTTAILKATIGGTTITESLPNATAEGKGITTSGVASFDEGEFAKDGKGYGWQWRYLAFTLADEGEVTLQIDASADSQYQWCSFGDVAVVSNVTTTAMVTAYNNFTMQTLGFENGQYAPYNNVAVLEAYAQAKAIVEGTAVPSTQTEVDAITTTLTSPTWTANAGDVDAIYNGSFTVANGTNPKGWTRSNNGWGQQITGLSAEANGVNEGTTTAWYYNNNGAWQYGNDGVYTMPLAANQLYKLTFKYRKNGGDWQSWMKASVLNGEDGLAVVEYPGADNGTTFQSGVAYFTTGAAGNYTLSIEQNGNAHLTDVSLVKADATALTFSETSTTVPANGYYATMCIARTLPGDMWNSFSLPFSLSADQLSAARDAGYNLGAIKKYSSANGGEITMEDATEIVAGEPYLVKPSTMITNPVFNGVIVSNPTEAVKGEGDYTFQAHLCATTLPTDGSVAYVSTYDNSIKKLTSGGINGMRAIFNIPVSSSVKALTIRFGDDAEDAIISIDADGNITEGAIYNLAGQRVNKAQKGIYIVNGKKYIVK